MQTYEELFILDEVDVEEIGMGAEEKERFSMLATRLEKETEGIASLLGKELEEHAPLLAAHGITGRAFGFLTRDGLKSVSGLTAGARFKIADVASKLGAGES